MAFEIDQARSERKISFPFISQCLCLFFPGLDDSVYSYAHFFINNNVTGQGLLNLTVDDLYKLHVEKLGHQEIILEALELLKNLVRFRDVFINGSH